MTCGVDGFGPKSIRRLVLIQHGPGHLHKSANLPLGYTILLRGIWCGILMLNPLITQEFFQGVVLELGAIVTSYCQDSHVVFSLGLLGKVDEGGLRLILGLEEEHPRVS